MAKRKGLEIDRRVGIAMSVLPPSQRAAIERLTHSPDSFARAASRAGRVQQMRTSGQPLYMMRVPPNLRLIYTLVGDTVYVVDLVERATLERFAARRVGKKVAKLRPPKPLARKIPDPVEK